MTDKKIEIAPANSSQKKKRTIQDYEYVTDNKTNSTELGKGSYGSVRLVIDKNDKKLYAIKTVTYSLS